jgi:hypothetical protein
VIPAYSTSQALGDWCVRTIESWKPQVDDVIISEDGYYHRPIHEIADLYILHDRLWPAKSMNLGWQVALMRGADFVAIMDLDAHWVSGSLREACVPGRVIVPSIVQHPETVSIGPMFIVPKEVATERGFLNGERFPRLQSFDADYQVRVNDIIHQSRQLKVFHEGGATTGIRPYEHPDWAIQRARAEGNYPPREIDPTRHAQRMQEDEEYRAKHTP